VIDIRGLRFAYQGGPAVLDGVDLAIPAGELALVAGPSGSGKSTLVRCLSGLVPHFYPGDLEGRVRVAGRDVRDHPPAAMLDAVGLVPQNPAGALFNRTVEGEVAFALESLGVPPAEIGPRVATAIEQVGLGRRLGQAPHTLSGGEQQRLLIAAALATRPAVLALDEPLAHLDPEMAEALAHLLTGLVAAGITVVVAEHRLGPLLPFAGRLVVLDAGRVVQDGPPAAVLAHDVRPHGLNVPLAVQVGQAAGMRPLPLSLEALVARLPRHTRLSPLPDPPFGSPPAAPRPARPADATGPLPGPAFPPHRPPAVWPPGAGPVSVQPHVTRPDAGPAAVAFEDVEIFRPGATLLHQVDLAIPAGQSVALLGRNGAGKTTLLMHMNGLRRAARGTVRVRGVPVGRRPTSALARDVGFVFQNPNDQFFLPTVREELEVGPRALGRREPAWLDGLVERFGLGPLLARSPFRLSEGQKKRVSFAAALAARPPVVVLDEPTTGQDEVFRGALVALAGDLARSGHTVVMATHDVELADAAAGRWVVLSDGYVDADGAPAEVLADVDAFRAAGLRPAGWTWLRHVLALAGAAA